MNMQPSDTRFKWSHLLDWKVLSCVKIEVGCQDFFSSSCSQPIFLCLLWYRQQQKKIRWYTQFSFWDFKIWHFSYFFIILECKEHIFLMFLFVICSPVWSPPHLKLLTKLHYLDHIYMLKITWQSTYFLYMCMGSNILLKLSGSARTLKDLSGPIRICWTR